jgi:hypothetical protein
VPSYVRLRDVAKVKGDLRCIGEAPAQNGFEARIQFDSDDTGSMARQHVGECAGAGSDFEDGICGLYVGSGDDLFKRVGVM